MQRASGLGVCTLPKPPAGRALFQVKEAPQAAFPSWCFPAQTKRRTEGIRVPVPLAWGGSSTSRVLLRLCPESACRLTFCNPMDYSTPDFPVHSVLLISWSLLRLMSIDDASVHVDIDGDMFMSVMPSNHLILHHPFFCLQSFPASGKELGSFPMSWLFTPGGHRIGASASALFFTMNIEG